MSFRAVYTGTRPGVPPPSGRGRGGGDAGSLLPGVLPPELIVHACGVMDKHAFVTYRLNHNHHNHHNHHNNLRSHFGSRPFRAQLDNQFVVCREMVWFSVILGLMSSGLLPRVCASGVPGQSKTHGQSGFENDFGDLVTDLPAALVAFDVPAAFCATVVFVDAAMIAYDYWGLMIGAALSVYVDAAILCSQKMMNGLVFERFLELLDVFPDSMAHSGLSICVSPCGLMAWLSGAHLVAEMCGCGFRSSCCNVVPVFGTVFGGCYRVGVCWVAATTRAALVELFDMRILHAAAANVAAILSLDLINFVVTSEAFATEYVCNVLEQHAAAASAAALRWNFQFHFDLGRRVRVCFIGFLVLAIWNGCALCWVFGIYLVEKSLRLLWARGR